MKKVKNFSIILFVCISLCSLIACGKNDEKSTLPSPPITNSTSNNNPENHSPKSFMEETKDTMKEVIDDVKEGVKHLSK